MVNLTNKQQKFIEEYLIDLNATQAAIRAGYSPDTAKEIGCENLTKPNIRNAIQIAIAERSKRTGINQDRVLMELAKIALLNINDIVDVSTGKIKENVTNDDLACIQSVKVKTTITEQGEIVEREIKMYDKLKAIEQAGKHLGMWKDKIEIENKTEKASSELSELLLQLKE